MESNTKTEQSNTYSLESNTYGELTAKQQQVIAFCSGEAHSALEIFEYLGISKQAKHYDIYVKSLLNTGILEDVTPNKSRMKKYKVNGNR